MRKKTSKIQKKSPEKPKNIKKGRPAGTIGKSQSKNSLMPKKNPKKTKKTEENLKNHKKYQWRKKQIIHSSYFLGLPNCESAHTARKKKNKKKNK